MRENDSSTEFAKSFDNNDIVLNIQDLTPERIQHLEESTCQFVTLATVSGNILLNEDHGDISCDKTGKDYLAKSL